MLNQEHGTISAPPINDSFHSVYDNSLRFQYSEDPLISKLNRLLWIAELKNLPLYKATDWSSSTIGTDGDAALGFGIQYLNGLTPYDALILVHSQLFPEHYPEIQTP
ncbi:MAG: hypothetical protein [Microviridae sp.]|nr:MAG: hypothetical protein [Microviridae sp.]